ncbi:MAG: peptidoglycan-associated lipoprotein Pal [Methyloprofundus sp.]|nr:peptidoglycan-associated lipoprotein Pal [Methyloprofundus sp.]
MKINKIAVSLSLITLLLSACAGDGTNSSFSEDTDAAAVQGNAAITTGIAATNGITTEGYSYNTLDDRGVTELDLDPSAQNAVDTLMSSSAFSDPSSPLSKRTIYFEYDSSQVLNEFLPVIEAHAQYMMTHPNQRIVLEGHSDERGTREYNIALAEQRAKSVFKMLQLIGVMNHQVNIVSYGEEKPASLEYNNDSYALNRRVEIVYQ